MSIPKKVSFSETSLLIIYPCINKTEKCEMWFSSSEIESFKTTWARTIRQVQSMDMELANLTDATEYMGLERYLSKKIYSHCEKHRQDYMHSVVAAQNRYSCHEEFAQFAQNKSRSTVGRSHAVGVFYASRYFQESSRSKDWNHDCATKDAEPEGTKENFVHPEEPNSPKLDEKLNRYCRTIRNGIRSENTNSSVTVARSA